MTSSDFSPAAPPPPPPQKSNTWIWWVVGIVAGCLILTCCAVLIGGVVLYSQGTLNLPFLSGLNYNATASGGQVDLQAGFGDDPFSTTVNAGGTLDVSTLTLSASTSCNGYVDPSPSFSLNWTGSSNNLRILVASGGEVDATLVVRAPDGTYVCNDDAGDGSYDPMVDLPTTSNGQYDIWVGTYSSGSPTTVSLYITELDYTPQSFNNGSGGGDGGSLNLGGTPTYGEDSLSAGFAPDPYTVNITSGGSVDVAAQLEGCTGYAASSPDFRLTFSGNSSNLRFFFVASQGDDTTLIVNDPAANWYCNDDAPGGGRDPLVEISDPLEGVYDIWVGSYSSGDFSQGVLYITELDAGPQDYEGQSGLDYSYEGTYGSQQIGGSGNPSTYELDMLAGGSVDVFSLNLGENCLGYAAAAPDFEVLYRGSASRLRVFFVAADGSDTTLIINQVDSTWVCNDDSPFSLDPMVEITGPEYGTYDVWVGTIDSGDFVDGTLYVTEGNYHPGQLPY